MTTHLVLGSSGFLGHHLVQKLLQAGSRVIGVDLALPPSQLTHPHFHFIQGDVSKSDIWILLAEHAHKIKFLFHFASFASPHLFVTKSQEIAAANVVGLMHALQLSQMGAAKIIFASSSEVYGNPTVHPQPESYLGAVHCYGPRGSYDESKRLAESLVFCANSEGIQADRHGIVRIFNTYGPYQSLEDRRVIPQFIKTWKEQNVLFVHGEGHQTRSLCYVDDLLQGILRYAESTETTPMNIGSDEEISILNLAQIFQEVCGTKPRIEHIPSPNAGDPRRRRPDLSLAKARLHWSPTTHLHQGLEKTLKSYI